MSTATTVQHKLAYRRTGRPGDTPYDISVTKAPGRPGAADGDPSASSGNKGHYSQAAGPASPPLFQSRRLVLEAEFTPSYRPQRLSDTARITDSVKTDQRYDDKPDSPVARGAAPLAVPSQMSPPLSRRSYEAELSRGGGCCCCCCFLCSEPAAMYENTQSTE